jgi:competence protein ComEA
MTLDKVNRLWLLATFLLIAIILVSSAVIWLGRDKNQEIIILSPQSNQIYPANVIIDGAVANPGSFSLRENDTVSGLIDAAGGLTQNADATNLKIVVPQIGNIATSQRVNINKAEIWLLQALPGIGEVRAQSIVNYRSQNGPFKNIEELMKIPGFNESTFNKIKQLITISE